MIYHCPKCKKRLQIPEKRMGKSGGCKRCDEIFTVPNVSNVIPTGEDVHYTCPYCSKDLPISSEFKGVVGKCGFCGGFVLLPATTATPDTVITSPTSPEPAKTAPDPLLTPPPGSTGPTA